jgi:LPXTG-motif cell wall-anchored protein
VTDGRVGRCLTIGTGLAVGALGVIGLLGGGAVQASGLSIDATSNCSGAGAWVATWVVSITSDVPGETWRVESAAGASEPQPVADPIVLEQARSMDEPLANLDAVATLLGSGATVSATATVERPTACMSAPAPTNAIAETIDVAEVDPADHAIESTRAELASGAQLTAPSAPAVAPVVPTQAPSDVVSGAPDVVSGAELPATGSTNGALVAIALACVVAGALLVRLSVRPCLSVLSGASSPRRHRQLSSRPTSL